MQARISLVIPVYNEAEQIHDCLMTVMAQSVRPFEVIVVDNNSDDGTAALAANLPRVRVLREPRQGVVYARDRGFNAARGDIIARIDADTRLPSDWIASVQQIFADPEVDLVSGAVGLRGIALPRLASRVDLFWRRYLARRLRDNIGLQGANMALRRSVWLTVRYEVCHQSGCHEDFDLGLHAYQHGYRGSFDERLRVSVCHRQLNSGFRRFYEYAMTSPRTYRSHGHRGYWAMYRVVAFVVLLYPLIVIMSRGYDEALGRFSLRRLFMEPGSLRVNPASWLD